jgi:hypothetical protein
MPAPFPIQETQVGAIAYVHGIMNNGSIITMTGMASFEQDSDEITQTWNEKEKMDAYGNTQNIIMQNEKLERTIKFSPSGATRAAAATNSAFFTRGSSVTIANHQVAIFNGAWRVKSGTRMSMNFDSELTMDLPCEKWVNSGQNTALTGAAISG